MVATGLAPLCGAVAGLWWPVGRPTRLFAVGCVALVTGLAAGLLHAVAVAPGAQGCSRCPANLLAVAAASSHAVSFDRTATFLVSVAGLVVATAAVLRWWRSARLARRTTWPMLLGGAGVAALATAHSVHTLGQTWGLYDAWAGPVESAQLGLLVLVAVGAWWRLSLPRRTADRVARRVLAATPDPESLVVSLAREIDDRDLAVTYRRLDGSRLDADGQPPMRPPTERFCA